MQANVDYLGFLRCSSRLRKVPVFPNESVRLDEIDPRVSDEAEKEQVTLFSHQDRKDANAHQFLGK